MATKYCMFCGAQLPSTALFCPTCGNKQSMDESSIKVDQSVLENTAQENDEEESSAEYGLLSAWGYTKPNNQQKKTTMSNVVNNTKQSQPAKPIQQPPKKQEAKQENSKPVEQPIVEEPKRKGPKLGGRFEEEDYGEETILFSKDVNLIKEKPVEQPMVEEPEEVVEEIIEETIVEEPTIEESEEPVSMFEDDEEYVGLFDDDDDNDDSDEISNYMQNMMKGLDQPVPESLKTTSSEEPHVDLSKPDLSSETEDEEIPDDKLVEPEHTTVSPENKDRKFNPTGRSRSSYRKRNLSEEDESVDETFSTDSVKISSGITMDSDEDPDMLADEKEDLKKYKAMKAKEKEEQDAIKKSQEVAAEGRTKTKRQKETRKNIDFIISQRKVNEIQHEEVNVKGLDPDYDGYYETVKPIDFDKQKDNSAIVKTVLTGVVGFALISIVFYVLFSFFTL